MGNFSLRTLFFLSFFLAHFMFPTISQPAFFDKACSDKGNYTTNSPFKKNLDALLLSISSNNQLHSGFYNASSGENPDRATVMALCRGIVPLEKCRSCVNDSAHRIIQDCPTQKEAVGWYNDCQIRYSNNSIYGVRDSSVMRAYMNFKKSSDPIGFSQTLRSLLDRLRDEAASGTTIRKSAAGKLAVPSPSWDTIYAVVDCFPDLSSLDCNGCLSQLQSYIPNCCNASIGARITATSCQLNYEIQPFFELSPPPPPSPPPSVAAEPPPSVVKAPSPSLSSNEGSNGNTARTVIIVVVSIVSAIILIVGICIILRLRKRKHKTTLQKFGSVALGDAPDEISNVETIQFDFDTIKIATNDFSSENKLGQGGFGAVYMGKLLNGQHIAVKRLAHNSQQGDLEFKNEVLLVVKLQHRNLVRLLGFCLQRSERLLIYEFVPNGSLDHFIFDFGKRTLLDWEQRYKIINGVARGLLYLHEDSRLRIIHRDLKASNILLDAKMDPKIADFGMARLFEVDETQGNTSRIVGTYGYMAPEYILHGQFSVKSDVFSFGVLVLEIVSGQKNNCFRNGDQKAEDLSSFAWKNWRAGTSTNIIDSSLSVGSRTEMIRCIHIGLLCVQESIANRPTIASVVLMLSSSSLTLPIPTEPAFFMDSNTNTDESNTKVKQSDGQLKMIQASHSETKSIQISENEASSTELYPR